MRPAADRARRARAIAGFLLSAILFCAVVTANASASSSAKANLRKDVRISYSGVRFVTVKTRTTPHGGVVLGRMSSKSKTITHKQDGKIDSIVVANGEWAFERTDPSQAKGRYCWQYARVPDAFTRSFHKRYGGIGSLSAATTVSESKINDKAIGARTLFHIGIPQSDATTVTENVYAGAKRRIVALDDVTTQTSDLYTYPKSQLAVKVPTKSCQKLEL